MPPRGSAAEGGFGDGLRVVSPEPVEDRIPVFVIARSEALQRGLLAILGETPDLAAVGAAVSLAAADAPSWRLTRVLVVEAGSAPDGTEQWLPYVTDFAMVLLKDERDATWSAAARLCQLPGLTGLAVINKDGSSESLCEAVRLAARGAFLCDLDGVRGGLRNIAAMACENGEPLLEALSRRESQVLNLVALGLSNKAIGLDLGVSEGTVKAHVSHIMDKLRLANRSQLVAYALATGFALDRRLSHRP